MSRSPRGSSLRVPPGDDAESPILHVDMDAFFASVELTLRPGLRDRAVIVGGRSRGVVLSATYQARATGVRSAMPMSQALRLCPHAVVVSPDHRRYGDASRRVMSILGEVTPIMEQVSVDEAFLDVSGARRRLGSPAVIAAEIRRRLRLELDLPASVGVAATKFVAKVASAHAKPDGVLVVPREGSVEFLHQLPVGALWGVGERTERALASWGIRTVGELAHTPEDTLRAGVGRAAAAKLRDLAWARDPRAVTPGVREKSIGTERTFAHDVTDRDELRRTLLEQSHQVARRLRSAGMVAGGVCVKIRMSDFATLTRAARIAAPTDVAHEIFLAALSVLASTPISPAGVRLIGVRADHLTDPVATGVQLTLGEDGEDRRHVEVAMDGVSGRFGSGSVVAGSLIRRSAFAVREGDLS